MGLTSCIAVKSCCACWQGDVMLWDGMQESLGIELKHCQNSGSTELQAESLGKIAKVTALHCTGLHCTALHAASNQRCGRQNPELCPHSIRAVFVLDSARFHWNPLDCSLLQWIQ
jgi:hypothetical protein